MYFLKSSPNATAGGLLQPWMPPGSQSLPPSYLIATGLRVKRQPSEGLVHLSAHTASFQPRTVRDCHQAPQIAGEESEGVEVLCLWAHA